MMFEDMQALFDNFQLYKESRPYKFRTAGIQIESWLEKKAFNMEDESISKSYPEMDTEISDIEHPLFYQKHLLTCMNKTLNRMDIQAVEDSHRYFDYNLNFKDRNMPKPLHVVKVH